MTKRACVFVLKPLEDISCVSWNRQVQHILASASPGGRASVWDLRKNDLIIKVSDHSNRVRSSCCSQTKSRTKGNCHNPLGAVDSAFVCVSLFSDALLRAGLEPRGGHSAGHFLRGRPDASHPDVGFTFCYLSSQDFREPHTVNTHFHFGAKVAQDSNQTECVFVRNFNESEAFCSLLLGCWAPHVFLIYGPHVFRGVPWTPWVK